MPCCVNVGFEGDQFVWLRIMILSVLSLATIVAQMNHFICVLVVGGGVPSHSLPLFGHGQAP